MDVDTSLDLSTRLVRHRTFDLPADRRANVFLVIMESFAATKIGVLDNRYGVELSPCFDSLASGGILFDSIYSCGMHTYTGLFSTMTGMPHQFTELIMKQVPGQVHLWSLARILQKHGYRTFFFTTHDPHFDNMQGFVMQNGVMKTVSGLNFSDEDRIGTWGVPDHVMFDRAIQELSLPSDSPFFAILLTTTNHGPWNVPDVPFERVPDSVDKAVELNAFKYSDWALGRFVRQAQTNAALGNTLLFITADNGDPFQPKLSLDLSQYHIPLLILDTDCRIPAPARNHTLGSQLDILATVMGRLRLDYDDYSFGNDLLDTSAAATRFAHFSEWYQIGHIEDGYYLIYAIREKRRWLYRMGEFDRELSDSLPGLADSLESKAKAIFKAGYEQMRLPLTPFARDH
jgi:phosphoglycerol transferase MdoB-like AlkP superfamily enzyme